MNHPSPQNFIVACHGWSASNWVAYTLNQHPKIACAHNDTATIAADPTQWDGDKLRQGIARIRWGQQRRVSCPIDERYDELEAQKTAPFVGSVHTYRLRDLPEQTERFPNIRRQFRTVNLIRHPLDLVVSGHGLFQKAFRINLDEFSWTLRKVVAQGLDIVEAVSDRHGLAPGDYDNLCFFSACVVLGSLRLDLDAMQKLQGGDAAPWHYQGVVRMEDVTSSPAAFSDMLRKISGQEDLATDAYLGAVFQTEKINVHKHAAKQGTLQRWHDLSQWQREAFRLFFERFELRDTYEGFGYDFSFLDQ